MQLDMNMNSVVWKSRRDDKGENEMKGGLWILGMKKAACHQPEDLNSCGWDAVTICSERMGKERPKTQHNQKWIDLRDGHSRTGGGESQCGVDSERAHKGLSWNAKEIASGSPEHTLMLFTVVTHA